MNIVVIGTGYVGFVTGVGFASLKHNVSFIDLDADKIANLKDKVIPFFEPGLEELFNDEENFSNMEFYSNYSEIEWSKQEIVFICVQTPNNSNSNSVDTKFLESAIKEVTQIDNEKIIVTIKSTIPPYEIENICTKVGYEKEKLTFNPEFLREGSAVFDFFNPERVVIGGLDLEKTSKLKELYSNFETEILVTDPISSQLIKYLANTYLPLRLSFVNEASRLVKYSNGNLQDVLKGVGLDSRIGSHYFRPSPSWGGSCFPKDLVEVNNFYDNNLISLPLISNILSSNYEHLIWTSNIIIKLFKEHNLENIILIGAAFKEDTDDLRNSPTIDLYNSLKSQNCNVQILDTTLSLKDMQQLTNVHDINENSLIVYMYPPKEDLEEQINSYIENKNCYIYYPWK